MNGLFIIAHAPLASALRQCVLHVFPEAAPSLVALDVPCEQAPGATLAQARALLAQLATRQTLLLTDVLGATPCNTAQQLVDGVQVRLIAGVNLPMLLRSVTYCRESLDQLVARAVAGGTQGVVEVAPPAAPPAVPRACS